MEKVKMVLCSKCQEKIEKRAKVCPHCNAKRTKPLLSIVVLSIGLCWALVDGLAGVARSGENSIPEENRVSDLQELSEYVKTLPEKNLVFKWNIDGTKVTINNQFIFTFVDRDDETGILYYKSPQEWLGVTVSFGSLDSYAIGDSKTYVTDAIKGL